MSEDWRRSSTYVPDDGIGDASDVVQCEHSDRGEQLRVLFQGLFGAGLNPAEVIRRYYSAIYSYPTGCDDEERYKLVRSGNGVGSRNLLAVLSGASSVDARVRLGILFRDLGWSPMQSKRYILRRLSGLYARYGSPERGVVEDPTWEQIAPFADLIDAGRPDKVLETTARAYLIAAAMRPDLVLGICPADIAGLFNQTRAAMSEREKRIWAGEQDLRLLIPRRPSAELKKQYSDSARAAQSRASTAKGGKKWT